MISGRGLSRLPAMEVRFDYENESAERWTALTPTRFATGFVTSAAWGQAAPPFIASLRQSVRQRFSPRFKNPPCTMKPALLFVALLSPNALALAAAEIHLAQGILAGEVTPTTAILQTRLTASPGLIAGDVAGAPGVGRFEIGTSESLDNARQTPWITATPERDFILKAHVDGLRPNTQYHYRVL